MKTTPAQTKLMARMLPGKWYTAPELRAALATIKSLIHKGLIRESPNRCYFRKV